MQLNQKSDDDDDDDVDDDDDDDEHPAPSYKNFKTTISILFLIKPTLVKSESRCLFLMLNHLSTGTRFIKKKKKKKKKKNISLFLEGGWGFLCCFFPPIKQVPVHLRQYIAFSEPFPLR